MSFVCSAALCPEANKPSRAIGYTKLPYCLNCVLAPKMPFGPCPVLIPSCSWAVYGSLRQASFFEFRPKHCQTCAETTRQLQSCSWFWLCSFTCGKLISLFRSTNQHVRQDHQADLSLHSSNPHMQDKELDPQKEQHLPSYMVRITHTGKRWGIFQQHMVSSVGTTILAETLQTDFLCFALRYVSGTLWRRLNVGNPACESRPRVTVGPPSSSACEH